MGAKKKKKTARATPKARASKKPVAKTKAKGASKASKASKAKPPKQASKAKSKPAAKKRSKGKVAAPHQENPDLAVDGSSDETGGDDKKPGRLARLKSGVGSLLAKMTGRGTKTELIGGDGVPREDGTIEVVTSDIVQADAAPKKPSSEPTEV
jgi:hypothetical protein